MRRRRSSRHLNSGLAVLEAEFDALFASMQSSKVKHGTQAAFSASPEELSNAALAAAQREAEAMTIWEARLDILGPFASPALLRDALDQAPRSGPTADYLSGYLAGLEVRAPDFLRGYLAGRGIGINDPDAIESLSIDPALAKQLEVAEGVMKENRTVLRRLANSRRDVRLANRKRRLLKVVRAIVAESADPRARNFDCEAWLDEWLCIPQPALGGSRPIDQLRTNDGMNLVACLLESMRSGAYL